MSINLSNIRKNFRSAITGKTGVPANNLWAWEGEAFTPPVPTEGTLWVKESMFVADEKPVVIGNLQEVSGFYMAVVHIARNSGLEALETATKAIRETIGAALVGNGVEVAIDKASREGSIVDVENTWKARAVRFFFRAYAPV